MSLVDSHLRAGGAPWAVDYGSSCTEALSSAAETHVRVVANVREEVFADVRPQLLAVAILGYRRHRHSKAAWLPN